MQVHKQFTDQVVTQFRLSERVPKHNYRRLSELLDREFLRAQTRPVHYSHTGQFSPAPVVFFKLVLVGRLENIASDRCLVFFSLRDSGVAFVCCDMPNANTLTVGLFTALAQHEHETTSKRTKHALAAKKARSAQLGTPSNLTDAARERSLLVQQAHIAQHQGLRQTAAFVAFRRTRG